MIRVELTRAQFKALLPLFVQNAQADNQGSVVAQLFSDGLQASFVPADQAAQIQAILGGKGQSNRCLAKLETDQ